MKSWYIVIVIRNDLLAVFLGVTLRCWMNTDGINNRYASEQKSQNSDEFLKNHRKIYSSAEFTFTRHVLKCQVQSEKSLDEFTYHIHSYQTNKIRSIKSE